MERQKPGRCPHYQIYSERLGAEGQPAYLAIRRCLLTERLVGFLRECEEGRVLAKNLMISISTSSHYAFVGPDLEAVTQQSCDVKRCEESCTPGYLQHLDDFQLHDPAKENVTCEDKNDDNEKPMTAHASTSSGASGQ